MKKDELPFFYDQETNDGNYEPEITLPLDDRPFEGLYHYMLSFEQARKILELANVIKKDDLSGGYSIESAQEIIDMLTGEK